MNASNASYHPLFQRWGLDFMGPINPLIIYAKKLLHHHYHKLYYQMDRGWSFLGQHCEIYNKAVV